MDSTQSLHPVIQLNLKKSRLVDLAKRNAKTGFAHPFGLAVAIYLSPFRNSYPVFCITLFLMMFFGVLVRSVICIPKVQKKIKSNHWNSAFYVLTVLFFAIWSTWLCTHIYFLGMGDSSYFNAFLIISITVSALMGFAPSKKLMYSVVIITVFPSFVMLLLGNKEANIIAIVFGMSVLYLINLSKQNSLHYDDSVINRELAIQNKQIMEGVLHSVPGMVSCVDHHLKYIWVNSALNEKFGFDVMNIVRVLGSFLPNDEFPTLVKNFISSGKEVDQFRHQMIFPDGSCWMMVYLSSYQEFEEGRVLIVAYDIQSAVEAEMELDHQRSRATESAKLATLGEMSAGIAHEINNPLAVMTGRAGVMIEELKNNEVPKEKIIINLQKIISASERIAKIIKGLKSFSRNGDEDAFQITTVESMVQDVLDFSKERFKSHGVEIKLKMDSSLSVNCRSIQIQQVLLNLLSNSFDAIVGTDNPWVLIESQLTKDHIELSVTDSGKGIAENILQKIMQPFYTTKEIGKGTGLGLSISHGIIKSHGGEFYYDSNSANTRFVIQLPLLTPTT